MTVKIRLEAVPGDVQNVLRWLQSTGARLTGITRLYANRGNPEARLYAVLTPPENTMQAQAVDRVALAQEARQQAQKLRAVGDTVRAAYYEGIADGLET